MGMNLQRGVLLAGYGVFPSVYQCLFQHHKAPQEREMEQEDIEYKLQGRLKLATWATFLLLLVALLIV